MQPPPLRAYAGKSAPYGQDRSAHAEIEALRKFHKKASLGDKEKINRAFEASDRDRLHRTFLEMKGKYRER